MSPTDVEAIFALAAVVVTGFGALIGAGVKVWFRIKRELAEIKEHAAVAREQVANEHDTNLRDENDDRHEKTMAALADLRSSVATKDDVTALKEDVKRLDEKDRGLAQIQAAQGRRLDQHIEQTARLIPLVTDLHSRYGHTRPKPGTSN